MNQKGNIIVFALTAVAVMSITAALLTTAAILEVKKSSNVERALFARYNAETGIENALFILNKSFTKNPPQSLDDIKTTLGFNDPDFFGESLVCADEAGVDDACETLLIAFGVRELPVTLKQNEVLTINLYEPNDRNQTPFDPLAYNVDTIVFEWDDASDNEFEVTFLAWEESGGSITIYEPMKRFVDDASGFSDPLDGSVSNSRAVLPFPCDLSVTPQENLCDGVGKNIPSAGTDIHAKLRIRLLNAVEVSGITIQLYNGTNQLCDYNVNDPGQCVPGFIEIVSTGEARVGGSPKNRQALRVMSNIPGEEGADSVIWDYVIFSDQSLAK